MDQFRPEYIDAVYTARWNAWLVPPFLVAPTVLGICYIKRLNLRWLCAAVLVAMFAT